MKRILLFVFIVLLSYAQRIDTSFYEFHVPLEIRARSSNLYYQDDKIIMFLSQKPFAFRKRHILAYDITGKMYLHKRRSYFYINRKGLSSFFTFPSRGDYYGIHKNLFWLVRRHSFCSVDFKKKNLHLFSPKSNKVVLWYARILNPYTSSGNVILMIFDAKKFKRLQKKEQMFHQTCFGEFDMQRGDLINTFGQYPALPNDTMYHYANWFTMTVDTTGEADSLYAQFGYHNPKVNVYYGLNWSQNTSWTLPEGHTLLGTDKEFFYTQKDSMLYQYSRKTKQEITQWDLSIIFRYKNPNAPNVCIARSNIWYSNGFHFTGEKRYIQYYRYDFYDKNKVKIEVHTIYFE